MKTEKLSKYERAKKKVASIRGFYNHVAVYVIINILLVLLRDKFTFVLLNKQMLGNPDFLNWIDWNVYGTAIIWSLVLIIHGLKVFGNFSPFGKAWEERQIQKYMDKNNP